MASVPAEIFKAYDIRGIVATALTPEVVRAIGRALGTEARARAQTKVAIGRDGRLTGPELSAALAAGLAAAGVDVIDIGMAATPMGYFAAHHLNCGSVVMVTGSHNPPEYNGLKMVLGGVTLALDDIQRLRARIESGDLAEGAGRYSTADVREAYLARIAGDVKLARTMRIVIDCGNGVAGASAPELFRRLGCKVTPLYCEVDGNFPNHHPDPSKPENLRELIAAVRDSDAELGLAFDGDGDRLGVVTPSGQVIWPDRQLMLYAAEVLQRHPGAPILFDVKCTAQLPPWVRQHGGEPVMGRTGHSLVKAKMKEIDAPLAGEMSGHIFFKDRWYGFDDAQYGAARLLELLSREPDAGAVLEALPDAVSTPELKLETAEGANFILCERLKAEARFPAALSLSTIDGVRADYADGFGLARPSNTTPCVVLRFEGTDAQALARVQTEFRAALLALDPTLTLPF